MRKKQEKKYSDFENVEKMRKNQPPEEFPEGAFKFPAQHHEEKEIRVEVDLNKE